jgi:hypothetical protein
MGYLVVCSLFDWPCRTLKTVVAGLVPHHVERLRAIRVIVLNVVDSRTHRISPHRCRIERLEHRRNPRQISEGRVQPEIVIVGLENDWHSVVNVRSWDSDAEPYEVIGGG